MLRKQKTTASNMNICKEDKPSILLIYTGGTIGMIKNPETGYKLLEAGVVSGVDGTTECAVTKLMFLFGQGLTPEEVKDHIHCSLIGEVTVPENFYTGN